MQGLLPAIRVALTPALRYELPQLAHLAAELEHDLTNIVFDYAYNTRHKIGAEDLKTIGHIPYVSEHIWRLMPCHKTSLAYIRRARLICSVRYETIDLFFSAHVLRS